MGLSNKTAVVSAVRQKIDKARERVETATFLRMSKLGEDLVNYARQIPAEVGYTDRTGNLRSSTGYVVAKDGKVINSDFKKVLDGSEGLQKGIEHAEKVLKDYQKGYVLIVVAGMEYALAVESHGRDVLTSAELKGRAKFPAELEKLKEAIRKMKI